MKNIAIIGLGQFGYQTAISLTQKGFEVLAVDKDVELVSEIKESVFRAAILDATDEKAMRAIGIDEVNQAVVAIGTNVQASLLVAALLQHMDIPEIYVRAINALQENILKSMGIRHIINIERDMGNQLANSLSSDVGRYVEISERHSLLEARVPKLLVGKTLKELQIRGEFQINIVGIKTQIPQIDENGDISYQTSMTDIPDPNYPLKKSDVLVIAGTDENLNKFLQLGGSDE